LHPGYEFGASILRAGMLPAPTATPISQNSDAAPIAVPATPNNKGITVLDMLIAIDRNAIASP